MAHHYTPARCMCKVGSLNAFSDTTNLVHLEQQAIASLLFDGSLDPLGVRDSQIVTDNLDVCGACELGPLLPVILLERIFDGADGVLADERLVQLTKLFARQVVLGLTVGILKVKIVLSILKELRRSNVHANLNLPGVTSLFDSSNEKVKTLLVILDVGSKATLITDIAGVQAILVLNDSSQMVVNLRAHTHGFTEVRRTGRQNHEFLHGQLVTSMATAVDNVECRDRQNDFAAPCEISDVSVQRNTLVRGAGLADGKGNTKDRIGAHLGLGIGAIKLQEEVVDALLIGNLQLAVNQSGTKSVVYIGDGLFNTLSKVLGFITITQLQCFMNTSRCA
eukprot:Colp12_sorted_trinity150504_noHs@28271